MSIFNLSTGNKAHSDGNIELGNSEPIPAGTDLKVIITEAKWAEWEGDRYIKLRWDVIDGEYKKRVIFQKIKVYEGDPEKADRQRMMLAAIDANAGGKLATLKTMEPSDEELTMCLTKKVMMIRVGVWEINDKKGNWVQAVQGANQKPAQPASSELNGMGYGAKPQPDNHSGNIQQDSEIPF